jgi:site-specific DNA-methyltransferase (adenine-specific)
MSGKERRGTSTSNFGVGRREGHDASAFYGRFPELKFSDDDRLVFPYELADDGCFVGDSRAMDDRIKDGSVALVVTSPPYFAGKAYEEALGEGHIPADYDDYLRMLHDVFECCVRKLEPGGRIAVNVANLGRKPYRSLAADVIAILEGLGLLLRGEVIWRKADGAGGNCAWGSFRSPSNPVLRDLTERVIIASKGRFDRAKTPEERRLEGYPHDPYLLTSDEFMEATLDVWDIPPESAKRVNHPAPFPVELPERLIKLYTYKDDLVLDPFLGSGSTVVAATRTFRRGAGYDMDPEYVAIARARVAEELATRGAPPEPDAGAAGPELGEWTPPAGEADEDFQRRASREGKAAQALARARLVEAGFQDIRPNQKVDRLGVTMNFVAHDARGVAWYFDVSGAFTTTRGGLLRTDTVWKSLGRAHVMAQNEKGPVVFLTSHLPKSGTEGFRALKSAGPRAFFDAVEMLSSDGMVRLRRYAQGDIAVPLTGFWNEADLRRT